MSVKFYDKIAYKDILEIKPYENNARINDAAIEALVKAIPVMGFNVPIVIDKNNVIVKGHSRYEALKRLGIDLVPCIIIDGTEKEIAEERLADNRLSELSSWDDEKLKYELREMQIDLSNFKIELPQIHGVAEAVQDVTQMQVQRAAKELVGQDRKVSSEKKSLIEVHCPNCGEDFFADLAEVMKYAE